MIRTYKFRLNPGSSQRTKLNKSLAKCCEIYNKLLETKIYEYENNKKFLSCFDLIKLIKTFKTEDPTLKDIVYSQVLQNVAVRLDLSFQAFYRRIKTGETPGFPRFKSKSRYNSMTYPQIGFSIKDNGKILKLSKIGDIKIRLHREFPKDKIKNLTITRDSIGNFYACFVCEVEQNILPSLVKSVGIDFGCKDVMTLSDNTKIENPKFYKKDLKELKKASSKYSVNKTKKSKTKLLHIHSRIANRRNNFNHQLSRRIINNYQLICIEDINIKQLVSGNFRNLNRTIFDSSWYQLKTMITYKAEDAGRKVVFVPAYDTTKECSGCGILVEKTLSKRVHTCPSCGLSIDRDLNASINILRRGLSSLGCKSLEASSVS